MTVATGQKHTVTLRSELARRPSSVLPRDPGSVPETHVANDDAIVLKSELMHAIRGRYTAVSNTVRAGARISDMHPQGAWGVPSNGLHSRPAAP